VDSVRAAGDWPVGNAAVTVVRADGEVLGRYGDGARSFRLASVSKLLTAYTALIAFEEGVAEPDTPAGPEGSTFRHLLAHAAGLAFDEHKVVAPPGRGGCTPMPGSSNWPSACLTLANVNGPPAGSE